MQNTQAPLAGIRVIDFGHYIAGPLTGMLLADQGAEVIKIDRPGSTTERTPQDAVYNRNKKRIELNLKQSTDLETARALIQSADVVIENFRPGVMDRLGLGADAMTALKPNLVYLSLPGFASTDTERAAIRAFEGVVCAATGLYTDLQVMRRMLTTDPIYTPVALGSTYGAIHGAIAITLALYNREKRGIGEVIEVPLAGAAMSAMAIINLVVEGQPNRFGMPAFTDEERAKLPEWRMAIEQNGQQAMQAITKELTGLGSPITGTLQAGDGKWVYFIAGGHSRNTRALLMALGLYDELLSEGMVDVPVFENFDKDNNLADSSGWSREWHRTVAEKMQRVVATEPAEVWVERLTDVGVPAAVHRTAYDWLHAPETDAAALTVAVDEPDFGKVRQIGVQTWLSSTDASYMQPKSAQPLSRDELAVLISNSQPRTDGAPSVDHTPILQGVRVLDLSNVLAGPASARTLAEYGAEVIKIDPPDPNFGPNVSCKFPIEVSPGKRSMILDIKTEPRRKIFYELVKTADVIVHNFRPSVPKRMGIDYESLKAIRPELIYVNLTAFNGLRPGPWMERPGFDPLLQAATGIQLRYGGDGEPPVLHGWASCIDYITGYSATFGATLALLRRKRNGGTGSGAGAGDVVTTSLAQGAQLVQVQLKSSPVQLLSPNPKQGHHTREILDEMGYGQAEVNDWLAAGVIKEQLHTDYLPG